MRCDTQRCEETRELGSGRRFTALAVDPEGPLLAAFVDDRPEISPTDVRFLDLLRR